MYHFSPFDPDMFRPVGDCLPDTLVQRCLRASDILYPHFSSLNRSCYFPTTLASAWIPLVAEDGLLKVLILSFFLSSFPSELGKLQLKPIQMRFVSRGVYQSRSECGHSSTRHPSGKTELIPYRGLFR
jgi:hypothetical protein